jgi:rhodanese-related sulfurtransferase
VPHSISIPLARIAEITNLRKLDPGRTSIVYSDNGQTGQMAATVLNLLGYRAVDMKFGMMDWNKSCVAKSLQWSAAPAYPVEVSQKRLELR